MKKLFIVSLLALILISPSSTSAQTITQEEVNAQLLTLINSLMTQVQELMKKLIAMQDQQVTDSQVLQTVVQQSAPVQQSFGTVSQPSSPSISFGTQTCSGKSAVIPFVVNGSGWVYGDVVASAYNKDGNVTKGGASVRSSNPTGEFWFTDDFGTTSVTTTLGKSKTGLGEVIPMYTLTDTIFIGDVCQ